MAGEACGLLDAWASSPGASLPRTRSSERARRLGQRPAPPLEVSPARRGGRAPECADDLFTANGGCVALDVPGPQSVCHGVRDRYWWRNRAPLSASFDPEWIHGRGDLVVLDLEARKPGPGRCATRHARSRQAQAGQRAAPMPWAAPPTTCPSARVGFTSTPASWTMTYLSTRTSPVSTSTSTIAACTA